MCKEIVLPLLLSPIIFSITKGQETKLLAVFFHSLQKQSVKLGHVPQFGPALESEVYQGTQEIVQALRHLAHLKLTSIQYLQLYIVPRAPLGVITEHRIRIEP